MTPNLADTIKGLEALRDAWLLSAKLNTDQLVPAKEAAKAYATIDDALTALRSHEGTVRSLAQPAVEPVANGNPLLWNVHCMYQQEDRGQEWQAQMRELLAAIEQHLQRVNYPSAALTAMREKEETVRRCADLFTHFVPRDGKDAKQHILAAHGLKEQK